MISRFFINHPVFAWVIAVLIMMAGGLSIMRLPVSQYPRIAPPAVTITAIYPGASAKTVEDSVTQLVEQKMKGLDGLLYMSSTSDSAGQAEITLTFDPKTDPDIAQVQVQNKLQSATPLLPQEVQQQGVTVAKASNNFLMVLGLYSKSGRNSTVDLGDYLSSHVQDQIARLNGVGDVQTFGSQYAMRIWLDPAKLASYSLTPSDVATAIRAQNAQVSAGQLGGSPASAGVALNATVSAQSRLETPEQFAKIVLKASSDGAQVRLSDVARVELGAETYDFVVRYNGLPAAGLAVKLAPGANALTTAGEVKAKMKELSKAFPSDISYTIAVDTTPFVTESIQEVVKTLIEAVALVFIVMFIFLQNWRATLIPAIAVPVVLLGTFGVLSLFGFSINVLTMFGLVLAIGLLVDDAIVVVENVERVMDEEGLSPKEATRKSMDEITGALFGIALVLSAVFIPMAFLGGSQGIIFRQFSITIVSAMGLSILVALVLTPALCATFLKPAHTKAPARGFFGWFNRNFDRAARGYESGVKGVLARGGRYMLIYGAIAVAMGFLFLRLPSAFLPEEDQGQIYALVQLPSGSPLPRTLDVLTQVREHFLKDEKEAVDSVFTVAGFSYAGTGQNAGLGFVHLKDFSERKGAGQAADVIAGRSMGPFSRIRDAFVFAVTPPAVAELGNTAGFDFYLQDTGGLGHDGLIAARNQLLGMAAQDPNLAGVRPNGQEDAAQLKITIDQSKASAMGLSIADINSALSAAWGGSYVNDFTDHGRTKKVYIQGDAPSRMTPEDLNKWYVRNGQGAMAPFASFGSAQWTKGPSQLQRYNGLPAVNIQGAAAPGKSSGDAMKAMERLVAKLPPGLSFDWTGMSYQERAAGSTAPLVYALSLVVVFLVLAALYESWSIPLAVILVVPLGVFGAVVATTLRGLNNDIFFQVGLLTTIGLSAKNAILIVEFAKEQRKKGMGLMEATVQAARIRLRPIIMTSLAFICGVIPLALASGASSGSQHAIGTGVIGGMLSATVLAIFFVPLFFVLVSQTFERKPDKEPAPAATPSPVPEV